MIYKVKKLGYTDVVLADADCPDDGGKYELVCATHGCIVQDSNKKRLWSWASAPHEWCEPCFWGAE